jgi:hypothetical protein
MGNRVVLKEQNLIDSIVRGEKKGNYYLLVGEKVRIDL